MLICHGDLFLTLSKLNRRKAFFVEEKLDILILAPGGASKEKCCTGCHVRNCTVNVKTIVTNRKDAKKYWS